MCPASISPWIASGNLQLASCRRPLVGNDLVDFGTEEVDADHRKVRDRFARLFDDTYDTSRVVEHGNAERRRVLDPLEQNLRLAPIGGKRLGILHDPVFEKVVAEKHAKRVIAQPFARREDGMGKTERCRLRDVGDARPELRAVAEGGFDLCRGIAGDDTDLGDPRRDELLQSIEEDGFVCHGYQLLRPGRRERTQSRSLPSGQNQPLDRPRASQLVRGLGYAERGDHRSLPPIRP